MLVLHRDRLGGFTLIELVVVLVLMGMVGGIVAPRVGSTFTSYERRLALEEVIEELNGMGRQARLSGSSIVIGDQDGGFSVTPDSFLFSVPKNLSIRVPEHIRFSKNGMCLGGVIEFYSDGQQLARHRLRPPYCQIEPR